MAMTLMWSVISAKIGAHIIQVITNCWTYYGISGEGTIRKFLYVEHFHKGCFLLQWFEECCD